MKPHCGLILLKTL